MRYSGFKVLWEGLTGNKGWTRAWREPEPKAEYDIVIIGGGGHGLSTAYYLAKEFGLTNVAVLEKGWLGSGNIGRNTTIIRSNYLLPGNEPFYEFSMKLWENLEQDTNYNSMVSQRSILNLLHTDGQRDAFVRRANAMFLAGADAELVDAAQLKKELPFLDYDNARFPIKGACSSAAAAPPGTTPSPGAMPAAPTAAASTSSRTARSRAFRSRMAAASGSRPRAARSVPRKWRCALPGPPAVWPRWPVCACPLKATCCRRSCPRGSSRLSPA